MALVILAHPDFQHSVANRAVVACLQNSGLNIEIRDIAALYPDYRIDAAAEQQALLRHETVVFQYPLVLVQHARHFKAIFRQRIDVRLCLRHGWRPPERQKFRAQHHHWHTGTGLPCGRGSAFPRIGIVQAFGADRVLHANALYRPVLFPRHFPALYGREEIVRRAEENAERLVALLRDLDKQA